jgi:hypothetical protein
MGWQRSKPDGESVIWRRLFHSRIQGGVAGMAAKTAAKGKDKEKDPELDEPIAEEEEAPPVADEAAPPSVKRSIGAKEPIIFKWKLLGTSDGVILTLFKAVEREEIEAHLERVTKEGIYTDLRIVEAGEKVVQTKSAIPVLHKPIEKPAPGGKSKKPAKPAPKKDKPVRVVRVTTTHAAKKKTAPAPAKKTKKAPATAKKKRK